MSVVVVGAAAHVWFPCSWNMVLQRAVHTPTHLPHLNPVPPAEPIAEIILARHDKARGEYKNRFRGIEIAIMQDYK